MKKSILFISLLCFSVAMFAQEVQEPEQEQAQEQAQVQEQAQAQEQTQAQEQAQTEEQAQAQEQAQAEEPEQAQKQSEDVKGAHPYKVEENKEIAQEFAHWSLIPHAGFNAFDGDFTSEMKHCVAVPAAGVALEYNFTPVWSIGIQYMYDMYTVTGRSVDAEGLPTHTVDTLLNGHMHKAGGYLAMDFMNLIFPRAEKKIVSIIPYVGGGAAWYRRACYYKDDRYFDASKGKWINPTHGRGETKGYINADEEFAGDYDKTYNTIGYLQAGVDVDFNLNRTLALGIRADYTYFTRDYVDGRGYHKQSASSYASKNNDGIFDVTLNLRVKFEAVKKTHVRNISSFETWEKKMAMRPSHDTVIIRHDSIIIRETYEQYERDLESVYYVYFDNNKANLDNKALITIQQVADRLEEDSTLYAVVTGYCDNTGSDKLNFALGDKRAANVVDELEAEHGIDSTHLHGRGMGKIIGRRSQAAYSPNRRASIRLVDKETFDRMKENLEEQHATLEEEIGYEPEPEPVAKPAPAPVKTVPLAESSRKEKVNEYKQRDNETVVTDPNTTLSKLARQYYDNTYCWVYIYIANKEKISNPNKLTPGIELTIPELTEQEMNITKDEGLVLYNNARLGK